MAHDPVLRSFGNRPHTQGESVIHLKMASERWERRLLAVLTAATLIVSGLGIATPTVASAAASVNGGITASAVASGLVAPTVTAANSNKPVGVKSPKGFPGRKVPLTQLSRTSCGGCYHYAGGGDNATNTGGFANLYVNNAFLDSEGDSPQFTHTLTEIAVQSTTNPGTSQIVEVGFHQNRQVNPSLSYHPFMFVYWWKLVGGVATEQCYNGCGWVNYTGTGNCGVTPGVTDLSAQVGTTHSLGIHYVGTGTKGWWVSYDNKPCGYYPADPAATSTAGNIWYPATYTSAARVQWFGEVFSNYNEPCTKMGNNRDGNSFVTPYAYASDPALIGSASFDGGSPGVDMTGDTYQDPTHGYWVANASAVGNPVRSLYYGGKGSKADGTQPGNASTC
jgi:hypothetical protein